MKALRIWLWLGLAFLASGPPSRAGLDQPGFGIRYLFLIDTSGPMAGQQAQLAHAITSRLRNGIEGQMRAAETFAIWTYAADLSTNRYLPMTWAPNTTETLAQQIARRLEDQPFAGEARLDKALARISSMVSEADSFTILVVNDGRHDVVGTPYDDKINAALRPARAAAGRTDAVFVTTLLVRAGDLVAWSLQTADGTLIRDAHVPSILSPPLAEVNVRPTQPGTPPRGELAPAAPAAAHLANAPANSSRVVPHGIQSKSNLETLLDTPSPAAALIEGDARSLATDVTNEAPPPFVPPEPLPNEEVNILEPPVAAMPDSSHRTSDALRDPSSATVHSPSASLSETVPEQTNTTTVSPSGSQPTQPTEDLPMSEVRLTPPDVVPQAIELNDRGVRGEIFLVSGLLLLGVAVALLVWLARKKPVQDRSSLISRSLDPRSPFGR